MPGKHKYPLMSVRPPDDVREAFRRRAAAEGKSANQALIDLMRQYAAGAPAHHAATATGTGIGHAASTSTSAIQSRDHRTPADSTDATA